MAAFGVTPYAPDQSLWTRATYPFRVIFAIAYLLLGPAALWLTADNLMTGTAGLSYGGLHQTVTREQFPSFFWLYTAITGGLGLGLTLLNIVVLYGAMREPEEKQ